MMLLSAVLAVAAAFIGLWLSYYLQASSGAAIVLAATAIFLVAWSVQAVRQQLVRPVSPPDSVKSINQPASKGSGVGECSASKTAL